MKKKWLMLICACLLFGACSNGPSEAEGSVPQATAITFTNQETQIARLTFSEIIGIEFQNYTQGSVFIWAIDDNKVAQEYLSPFYITEEDQVTKILVGFSGSEANYMTYDVTTEIFRQADTGPYVASLETVEAAQVWGEEGNAFYHLYQPERVVLEGKYQVLAVFWQAQVARGIDEASVFTINPEESLTDFFTRVSDNTDFAYVIMTEIGATF